MVEKEVDEEVLSIWRFFNNKTNGIFCEIGANHPIQLSQTYFLEQQGWHGILVEPLPEYVKLLREWRTSLVFPYACGALEDGNEVEIHIAGPASAISKNITNWSLDYNRGSIRVPLKTVNELFEEAKISGPIDFISIDVEGHELNVLKGLDFKKYQPKLFLIEDLVLSLKVHKYMKKHSYKIINRTGYNNWYIPKDNNYSISNRKKWKLFKKLYLGTLFRKLKHFFKLMKLQMKPS